MRSPWAFPAALRAASLPPTVLPPRQAALPSLRRRPRRFPLPVPPPARATAGDRDGAATPGPRRQRQMRQMFLQEIPGGRGRRPDRSQTQSADGRCRSLRGSSSVCPRSPSLAFRRSMPPCDGSESSARPRPLCRRRPRRTSPPWPAAEQGDQPPPLVIRLMPQPRRKGHSFV